jgi:LacI family transcriptional regulator
MNDVAAGGAAADRAPTLADVAGLAGVSTMTVSRVINGHAKVAADTRARVRAAMATLHYRPNMLARGLASGRSRSIGVLTADTTLYGPRAALRGVELAARDRGYSVTITHIGAPGDATAGQGMDLLRSRSIDGVILVQPLMAGTALYSGVAGVPVVALHAAAPGQYPLVTVDNRRGARRATEHLLGLGHRTIGHISGPPQWYESSERVHGWRDALVAAGIDPPPVVGGDWTAASGYAAGKVALAQPGVSAVFVANDAMALGLLHAMHELGLRCPDDVSVVGFDDCPEAEFFSPSLTTVRQDFDELGRLGVRLLLDLVEGGAVSTPRLVLEPQLIVRRSSAAPAPHRLPVR